MTTLRRRRTNGDNWLGNADGDVDSDGDDFVIWQRRRGASAAAQATPSVVPEPTGIAMLVRECGVSCGNPAATHAEVATIDGTPRAAVTMYTPSRFAAR